MEQKLIQNNKHSFHLIYSIILFFFIVGCKNEKNEVVIKKDIEEITTMYNLYYGLDLDEPIKTISNINKFIKSNFEELDYLSKKKYIYSLSKNDSILKIKLDNFLDFSPTSIKLDLKERKNILCQNNTLSIKGFFSKKFKIIDYRKKGELNQYLLNTFNDSVMYAVFSKNKINNLRANAIYKYKDEKVSLLCSKNFSDTNLLKVIEDSLYSYFQRNQKLSFDYALIPIELNTK